MTTYLVSLRQDQSGHSDRPRAVKGRMAAGLATQPVVEAQCLIACLRRPVPLLLFSAAPAWAGQP